MLADCVWPFKLAVRVTLWLLVTVPEVAVKVALVWPAGMVTLDGVESNPLLLPSATTCALEAAAFNATVQRLDALLLSAEGVQATDVSCPGCTAALAVSVKVCEPPFREAVSTAV